MRLLVTGGSGFLGGYVLREAARRGHDTVALVRSSRAAQAVIARGARPARANLDRPEQVTAVFTAQRYDALLSLASLGAGHGPSVVAAAEDAGIPRAVFVSTTTVASTVDHPTRQIRIAAERRIRSSRLAWTIARPTMMYGAVGDRNMSRLLVVLKRTPVLPVPAGRHLHQPVHVADVADALLTAVERPATISSTYDLAGPEPLPFTELVRIAAAAVGSTTRLVPMPLTPLIAMARAYERLGRRPAIRVDQLRRLGEDKTFAIDAAARDLGYRPRPFVDGIRDEALSMGLAT